MNDDKFMELIERQRKRVDRDIKIGLVAAGIGIIFLFVLLVVGW